MRLFQIAYTTTVKATKGRRAYQSTVCKYVVAKDIFDASAKLKKALPKVTVKSIVDYGEAIV